MRRIPNPNGAFTLNNRVSGTFIWCFIKDVTRIGETTHLKRAVCDIAFTFAFAVVLREQTLVLLIWTESTDEVSFHYC